MRILPLQKTPLLRSPLVTRAAGLLLGLAADRLVRDPQRHHPVAWFGTWAGWLERRVHADSTARGALHTAAAVAPPVLAACTLERTTRRHPLAHVTATAVVTWVVVGASSLAREGHLMADHLDGDQIDAARDRLSHLCSRDAAQLSAPELCRAATESMAENTADAAVASLFWGAVAGVPGLVGHRCVNTLDAMVGNLTPRYRHFGTASARLDDALDWLPARLTGTLACALAPTVGGDRARAWRVMRRDAHKHPSPNGGWCESAWAGALGVQLGGRNIYARRVEERPLLGEGLAAPDAASLRSAARLVGQVTLAAGGLAAGALAASALLAAAAATGSPRKGRP